ncbi:Hypothetical predicted protein [Olea europaea subsp. europaea]|uniref:Uncharacterized protein n=1 Tax=Olea europaea subsp. europaea TaxID=158383 RepID=A0A8S0QK46_OLEEU|nr:Hypothetical predicted protein [Olea europaea subsp. europaea]
MTKRKFSEMEEEQVETIEIDDSCPSPVSQKNGTPLRSIVCVRNREHIKNFEKTEECFILEFDPNDAFDISKISASENTESGYSPDLHVLAEKGRLLLVKIGMEHRDIAMHSTMNLGIMKGC